MYYTVHFKFQCWANPVRVSHHTAAAVGMHAPVLPRRRSEVLKFPSPCDVSISVLAASLRRQLVAFTLRLHLKGRFLSKGYSCCSSPFPPGQPAIQYCHLSPEGMPVADAIVTEDVCCYLALSEQCTKLNTAVICLEPSPLGFKKLTEQAKPHKGTATYKL